MIGCHCLAKHNVWLYDANAVLATWRLTFKDLSTANSLSTTISTWRFLSKHLRNHGVTQIIQTYSLKNFSEAYRTGAMAIYTLNADQMTLFNR